MRLCKKCNVEKDISEFLKRIDRKNGYYDCNDCRRIKQRKLSQTYSEKIRCRRKRRIQLGLNPDFEGNYNHEKKISRCKLKNDYVCISKKGHPNCQQSNLYRIYEHVYFMSEYLQRPLMDHEIIHHKNGLKYDNRIENLELWSTSHPSGQRVDDKIQWCKDFLSEYGYKVTKD